MQPKDRDKDIQTLYEEAKICFKRSILYAERGRFLLDLFIEKSLKEAKQSTT